LGERFQRLFDLSIHMACTVAEIWDLGWGERGGAWLWRRSLRVWEEEQLGECRHLLPDIVLQPSVVDQWLWRHDSGGGYSVWGVYSLLTRRNASEICFDTNRFL
jgi:hypothetical protein